MRTPKITRCWQTLKQASSINTPTFGPKVSLFFDSLRRLPGVTVKPLQEPKRQQWSGKTGLPEWSSVRLLCESQIMKVKCYQFMLWKLYCNNVVLSGKLMQMFRMKLLIFGWIIVLLNYCWSQELSKKVYSLRRWRFYLLPFPPRDAL